MALPTKCVFMKKPLETLMLAQSKRSLFVDYTLKCPVMTHVLTKNDKKSTLGMYTNFKFLRRSEKKKIY